MHICDMLLGYARVSTDDQDLTLQKTALKAAGCRRTFEEKVSGAKRARPELDRMLEQLRDDDVVVVTRLDRLARSTRDLLDIAEKLNEVYRPAVRRNVQHNGCTRFRRVQRYLLDGNHQRREVLNCLLLLVADKQLQRAC